MAAAHERSNSQTDTAASVVVTEHATEGGWILDILLNRPAAHNAVDGETAAQLLAAWRRFRDDDALTAAILRGAGTQAFCAGADLKGLATLAPPEASAEQIDDFVRRGTGPMGGTRIVQTKPVITVSQGFTYAGGLELYCHGHIRLAEPAATFSVACRRWGVPLVDGGTVFLPRLLGWGAALPLLITGQRIDAKRAHEIGLVWELVPTGQGFERAMQYARQICALPRDAMLADLNSAMNGAHLSLDAALEFEARSCYPVMRSESTQRGVESFLGGKRFWFE